MSRKLKESKPVIEDPTRKWLLKHSADYAAFEQHTLPPSDWQGSGHDVGNILGDVSSDEGFNPLNHK